MAVGTEHHHVVGVEGDAAEKGRPFLPLLAVDTGGRPYLSRSPAYGACVGHQVLGVPSQSGRRGEQVGEGRDRPGGNHSVGPW